MACLYMIYVRLPEGIYHDSPNLYHIYIYSLNDIAQRTIGLRWREGLYGLVRNPLFG